MQMPLLQSKFLAGFFFHVMAENWKHLKDTIAFSLFPLC